MGAKLICWSCQAENPILGTVGRQETCFKCRSDLHSCRNCTFYDPKAYNECHETSADRVVEKTRSNFCDHFTANDKAGRLGVSAAELISAAEALFKKK